MNLEEFREELSKRYFVQIGVPELSGADVYALYDEDTQLELLRVKIKPWQVVEIDDGKTAHAMPLDDTTINVLNSRLDEVYHNLHTNRLELEKQEEEEIQKVARMIKEIKTVRLKPEDRLAVIVKDSESIDREMLDYLRQAMLRWLGEKNSNRIMILVGDIELNKIRIEDGSSDQEPVGE